MTHSKPPASSTSASKPSPTTTSWSRLISIASFPVAVAVLIYKLDGFDPASLPNEGLSRAVMAVPKLNGCILQDFAYDADDARVIYTGCGDGWIKRVTVSDSSAADTTVDNLVYVGGRPLGLAIAPDKQIIVAEAVKGLLRITREGEVELLTNEAEGLKFRLTDGVDVAEDGVIYFTDASYKYTLMEYIWDILEGRPYGRFVSFDPSTNRTQVLVRDLYFANGVAVSPDQSFVVFCETSMRRCRKYYIKGEKKGSVENFIEGLPGLPDNIRYDGKGHYWIALATANTFYWDTVLRYRLVRKILGLVERYIGHSHTEKDARILAVDLEGKPVAHYYDPGLAMVTVGVQIGKYLYCGSLLNPYIIRLDLTQYPALPECMSM